MIPRRSRKCERRIAMFSVCVCVCFVWFCLFFLPACLLAFFPFLFFFSSFFVSFFFPSFFLFLASVRAMIVKEGVGRSSWRRAAGTCGQPVRRRSSASLCLFVHTYMYAYIHTYIHTYNICMYVCVKCVRSVFVPCVAWPDVFDIIYISITLHPLSSSLQLCERFVILWLWLSVSNALKDSHSASTHRD